MQMRRVDVDSQRLNKITGGPVILGDPAISAVQSDLSSEFPYIYGYMTFPCGAQQVGCADIHLRILLFRRWI